ncbi:MAG: PQQ-binding-like beta-propeller repeat protein [Calditrichota bacterium]
MLFPLIILTCGATVELGPDTFNPRNAPPFEGQKIDHYRLNAMTKGEPVVLDSIHTAWLSAKGEILIFNHQINKEVDRISGKDPITGFAYANHNFYWTESEREKNLVRYDNSTGKEKWREKGGQYSVRPLISGNSCIFTQVNGVVTALTADSGKALWEANVPGRVFASPQLHDSTIYVGTDQGQISALRLSDGHELWKVDIKKAAMLLAYEQGRLYAGTYSGEMLAIDPAQYTILWRIETGAQVRHVPLIIGGEAFWANSAGELYKINTSTGEYRQLDHLNVPIGGAPASASDGILYPGLDETLYLLNQNSGEILQKVKFDGRLRSTPLFIDNRWYVAVEDHWLYAVE